MLFNQKEHKGEETYIYQRPACCKSPFLQFSGFKFQLLRDVILGLFKTFFRRIEYNSLVLEEQIPFIKNVFLTISYKPCLIFCNKLKICCILFNYILPFSQQFHIVPFLFVYLQCFMGCVVHYLVKDVKYTCFSWIFKQL